VDAATLLVQRIHELTSDRSGTVMVAVDGWSAAGKSTLVARVAPLVAAHVIDGDDFYAGGTTSRWGAMSAAEKVEHCIDWRRQVPVLEALARGETARWHSYDWEADDGRLMRRATVLEPAPVIVLDGAYSARPELAHLLHMRVLLDSTPGVRSQRLIEREGSDYREEWNARWDEAEQWYFGVIMPPEAFDLVLPPI